MENIACRTVSVLQIVRKWRVRVYQNVDVSVEEAD